MKLEQFYVFPIDSVLNSQKRKVIEAQIEENAQLFERDVEYKWLKRGEEKFLRIVSGPVTVEIVFHDDRVELYGAAPAWARALLTNSRKQELQQRIAEVLVLAGFRK
jgi:RNase H-fold protein (predicted Holliday junction resolvase)